MTDKLKFTNIKDNDHQKTNLKEQKTVSELEKLFVVLI